MQTKPTLAREDARGFFGFYFVNGHRSLYELLPVSLPSEPFILQTKVQYTIQWSEQTVHLSNYQPNEWSINSLCNPARSLLYHVIALE